MPRETSDLVEREFKFSPFGSTDEDTLTVFRKVLPHGMFLELYDTLAALDLYIDTPDRFILANGSSLRLRTRSDKKSCIATLKTPRLERGRRMVRREVRTNFRRWEVLGELKKPHPSGNALEEWRRLYQSRTESEFPPTLQGMAWVQSFRRAYVVFGPPFDESPQPYAAIVIEDVLANDIRETSLESILPDFRFALPSPLGQIRYAIAEVEAIAQHMEFAAQATEFLDVLESAVSDHPLGQFDMEPKYHKVMRLFGETVLALAG
jgi:hypothetical protein